MDKLHKDETSAAQHVDKVVEEDEGRVRVESETRRTDQLPAWRAEDVISPLSGCDVVHDAVVLLLPPILTRSQKLNPEQSG